MLNINRCKILALLILLQLLSWDADAQKIALIDTRLKRPIVYTDSASDEHVSKGFIPVPVVDFDTLYSNLAYLKKIITQRKKSKIRTFQLLTKSTRIQVSKLSMAYGDRYLISLKTTNDAVSSFMTISDGKSSNRYVSKWITKMLAYIRSNNPLFIPPKEIHPRIYKAIMIKDR
jgi:hypothetical protein